VAPVQSQPSAGEAMPSPDDDGRPGWPTARSMARLARLLTRHLTPAAATMSRHACSANATMSRRRTSSVGVTRHLPATAVPIRLLDPTGNLARQPSGNSLHSVSDLPPHSDRSIGESGVSVVVLLVNTATTAVSAVYVATGSLAATGVASAVVAMLGACTIVKIAPRARRR
jgi:hypothetical protein